MHLHKLYNPITATPFKHTEDYMEFDPCEALKPYIRCFWGTMGFVVSTIEHLLHIIAMKSQDHFLLCHTILCMGRFCVFGISMRNVKEWMVNKKI